MVDETGGYRIGIKDVYDRITTVSAQLEKITNEHSLQIAKNTSDLTTIQHAMREMWNRIGEGERNLAQQGREFDKELDKRGDQQWQSGLAIIAILVAVASAVIQVIVR